jgi:A/G-specific adenine glycosylase
MAAYTQGLMDLGAGLCSVRGPRCGECALAALCTAHRQGRPEAYPVKTRQLKRSRREHALLWLRQGDAHWLVQRPATGVWAGLWSLPEFASVDALRGQLVAWPGQSTPLPSFTHVLTHLDLLLSPVLHLLPAQARRDAELQQLWPTGRWVTQADLPRHGLPAPVARLLAG